MSSLVQKLRDYAMDGGGYLCDDAADELDRLQALVSELGKDAARYRWLRERMTMRDLRTAMPTQWEPGMESGIDHAIDAAMNDERSAVKSP